MPTPYDVPPSLLIERLSEYLKKNVDEVKPPPWAFIVKTGVHAQRPPQDPDWWFVRCASLLRKVYVKGPIGIERLRSEYGGRKDRGVLPEHSKKGSGAIIRKALQQLEEAGLIETIKGRGRMITPKGRGLLDSLSTEIKRRLEKISPEIKKY
ncbi:MAG: 30S ribosomal protein S19 [Candidatus Bathyarchaeota archaeon B26-2]|nr:MAG: 30S ribosomal protein S19 [Candidatus Bathyarchaeota archaeon B26-2]